MEDVAVRRLKVEVVIELRANAVIECSDGGDEGGTKTGDIEGVGQVKDDGLRDREETTIDQTTGMLWRDGKAKGANECDAQALAVGNPDVDVWGARGDELRRKERDVAGGRDGGATIDDAA